MTVPAIPPVKDGTNIINDRSSAKLNGNIRAPQSECRVNKFEMFIIVIFLTIILLYTTHIIVSSYVNSVPGYCLLPNETGPCRGYFESWYYDAATGQCKKFIYGGCQGNDNNFETQEQCLSNCTGQSFKFGPLLKFN